MAFVVAGLAAAGLVGAEPQAYGGKDGAQPGTTATR